MKVYSIVELLVLAAFIAAFFIFGFNEAIANPEPLVIELNTRIEREEISIDCGTVDNCSDKQRQDLIANGDSWCNAYGMTMICVDDRCWCERL